MRLHHETKHKNLKTIENEDRNFHPVPHLNTIHSEQRLTLVTTC